MNYDCQPQRQNYGAHLLTLLLFALSGASFGLSTLLPPKPFLWQILGLLLLLPAIQLIARYMASHYLYRLHEYEDGRCDLEIFLYRGGDKMQLICCVGMQEITAMAPLTKKNARAPKGQKRYNYAQDLYPQKALVLSLSNADGVCEVLFCPDETLTALLAQRTAKTQEGGSVATP